MRTTVSGCVWLLMIGLGVACSSKSTGGGGGGGTILGGSGGTSGTAIAGSTSAAGQTSGNNGGTAANTGGTAANTGGTCADTSIVCLDAMTASGCDPVTGMQTTTNCTKDAEALGFVSSGCTSDPQLGDGCTIDSFSDAACESGTPPFAVCNGFTQDDAVDIYVACFQDTNGLKAVIQCYAKYYDEATNSLDCVGASTECDPLQTM